MTTYTVHFTQVVSISVKVDADDPEEAIETAIDEAPAGVCAQCSGWGQTWSRDDFGAELEPESVDDDGTEVWTAPERWARVSDR